MNRTVLLVVVAILVVVVAVLGFRLYEEENSAGLDIEVNESGISVDAN